MFTNGRITPKVGTTTTFISKSCLYYVAPNVLNEKLLTLEPCGMPHGSFDDVEKYTFCEKYTSMLRIFVKKYSCWHGLEYTWNIPPC